MTEQARTLRSAYTKDEAKRRPFLRRARAAAKLTIPSLIPEEGHDPSQDFETPWQSMGARGVKNLASKMLLALFPPNTPFFKLDIDSFLRDELTQDPKAKAEVDEAFGRIERAVVKDLEGSASRVTLFEALKHLLVSGNVLVHLPDEGTMRIYRLDEFVIRRDPQGNLLRVIIKETISPLAMTQAQLEAVGKSDSAAGDEDLDLYTGIQRSGDMIHVWQEVNDVIVPDSEGKYPLDKSPWVAPRGVAVDGEDYGRSYVEELFGDLQSLEDLSQAMVEGAQAAAKVLYMLRPGSATKARDLKKPSGEVITGNEDDVTVLQLQKFADFKVAFDQSNVITERLSFAFLLNTAIQRDAERVTAEEVRFMARELEDALGGIYSVLSQELQAPLAHASMRRRNIRPPKEVKVMVTTGLEALGRNHEQSLLDEFVQRAFSLNPEQAAMFVDFADYLQRTAANMGIEPAGLVRTKEEVQQSQQNQQIAELLANPGVKELIKQFSEQQRQQQPTGGK